jgi:stage IV sporulation protein FB
MIQIQLEPQGTPWDLKWSMFGIPVRVHPFFWLAAMLLSYHERWPFELVLLVALCIFVSILVHEFGHALSHVYYGDRHPYVILYHMGGLCVAGDKTPTHWQRIVILLWGPMAGFILGGMAAGAYWLIDRSGSVVHPYVLDVLFQLAFINFAWGVMNLIPAFPLDGGQIVREWILWKKPHRGDKLAFTISMWACILAVGAALGLGQLLPAVLFGVLGYNSYSIRKQIALYGGMGGFEGPREPWEQDADWWKKQ